MTFDEAKAIVLTELNDFENPKSEIFIENFEEKTRTWMDGGVRAYIRNRMEVMLGRGIMWEQSRDMLNEWLDAKSRK